MQPRHILVVIASLSAQIACSSASDGGAAGGIPGTNSIAGGSVTASAAGGALSSHASGGASASLVHGGAGGQGSGGDGQSGGASQISPNSTAGALAGRPNTDNSQPGGTATLGGRTDLGGSSAGGIVGGGTSGGAGRLSTTGVGGGGGRSSGGGSATGGTNNLGGAGGGGIGGASNPGGSTGSAGSTGASDSLCPSGITRTITVAKDGSGQFTSVQSAVNSITSGSKDPIRIDIKAGTYTEKLTIASRTNLCLVGAGATTTILSYGDSNASTGGTSTSASVHISADDFSAANLTFQNTYGSGSQAVALRTTGDRQQFLNCRFVGYQDTLYTHNGSQYFKNCYVQGNTDYVFGGATAVLQNCEVRNVENGSAVAAPNTDASNAYGIVFLGGKFTAASGVKSVALGRPWGADGFAAYLNVELGAHISAAGFVAMSGNQPQNARFHEYGSTGSGANASSRSSYQMTAAQAANYTLTKIFGNWTPTYSQ